MTEENKSFRGIETGPIEKDKKIIGHHFYEYTKDYFGVDDEEGMSSSTDWYIYPDGTFSFTTVRSWESWDIDGDGTFDSSKYDEYVEQMMECKTDWQEELKHNPWWYEQDELTDSEQGEMEEKEVVDSITERTTDELPF